MPAVLHGPHPIAVERHREPQRAQDAVLAGLDRPLPALAPVMPSSATSVCVRLCASTPITIMCLVPSLEIWLTKRITGGHHSVGAQPRSLPVPPGHRKPIVRLGWAVGGMGDVGRVRAGAQPYLGARSGMAPGRRHDGWWGDPAWVCGAAARSIRAVHDRVVAAGAGVELAAVHLGDRERDAHRPGVRSGRSPGRRVLAAGDSCA
jgi:hypothetical protein